MLRKWVSRYGDLFRDVLVRLASVEYTFYVILHAEFHNMRTEYKIIIILINLLLYFLLIINFQKSLDLLLPYISTIDPQSSEAVLSNFFLDSEAENFNPP